MHMLLLTGGRVRLGGLGSSQPGKGGTMVGWVPGTAVVVIAVILGFALAGYAVYWMVFRMGKDE